MPETFSGTLTGSSGSKLTITRAALSPAVPPPDPGKTAIPTGSNQVTVGGVAIALAAVNPTATGYPGGRGVDQLVAYQAPVVVTATNQYGVEVTVKDGVVTTVNDRQATGFTTGTVIPPRCVVLSAHGTSRTALLPLATKGAHVTFETVTAPPGPPPSAPPSRVVAGYLMDGQDVDVIPACYTQVRVAFVRMANGELRPVEWGGKTAEQTQAQCREWVKTPGRDVLLAVGGSQGGSNLGDVAAFVRGFRALEGLYGATGLDFDEEGGALNVTNAVAAAKELAKGRESTFTFSFVPPGGDPVAVYLAAAVACQRAGLRVIFGFQGYDAVDTDQQIMDRTADAVAALGQESVVVGFMVGDDDAHRTPDEIESLMRKVVTKWPKIKGAYGWQIKAPGTTDAMTRAARVLGVAA